MSDSSSDYINLIKEGERLINTWNKDTKLNVSDYLTLVILIITLTTSIINNRTLRLLTKINVLSYLNKDNLKQTIFIEKLLNKLLLLTDASRVCVGLFHNGTSIGSYKFKKMSVIYEARRNDANSVKDMFKDIDLNKLNDHLLNITIDNFKRSSKKDNLLSKECKKYLDFADLDTVYSILLNDDKGIYGILEVQYLNNNANNVNTFEETSIQDAKETLFNKIHQSISYIINNKKIPNIEIND